ncbi:MAG: PD-(D/E)XK nuclease family protein [Bacteroides sp.]|nr:PD-(D/E)XK nuclease family protein [Bacteroides sp.]
MDLGDLITVATSITEHINDSVSDNRHFNLIQAVVRGKLHETSHSRILGEMFRYDQSILKSFLDEFVETGLFRKEATWNVLIEQDHIDITIQGDNNVVIIENKVNNASEQYRQIDRYVEQKYSEGRPNIYVLYLTREYPLMPSEYSLDSSKDKCRFVTATYKYDIRKWLNSKLLTKDRPFSVHSALYHYINYLDHMFGSDYNSEIPNEIRAQIEKYLSQSGNDRNDISALERLSKELLETSEICRKLMNERLWAKIQVDLNSRLREKGLPRLLSMQELGWDLPDAGIQFSIQGMDNKFYAVVSNLRQRYIGIIDRNNNGPLDNSVVERLKSLFEPMQSAPAQLTEARIGSTYRYPFWFKVYDNDSLITQYLQLIDILDKRKDIVTIIDSKK